MPLNFNNILAKYRKYSFSEVDKGSRFERLMQAYLLSDPTYANKLQKVWLWDEFFAKNDLGGHDTGIDLVAQTFEGDFWAIQCKCYQEDTHIDKPAVDSFLSTSSRTFANEDMQTVGFAHRLWIATTNKWGGNAENAIKNQNPPVSRIHLADLQQAPVDWEKLENGIHGEQARTAKKSLRPHQKEALDKTHDHYATADRGKLIMACGTGKTFTSLKIAENEICKQQEQNKQGTQFDSAESRSKLGDSQTNGKGLILFLVPSIALLGQTLREWNAEADEPINAICICSDPEVSKKKTKNEDDDTFSVVDLALPASTNTKEILRQFEYIKYSKKTGMTVVFSTYQSIDVISKAQTELLKNGFSEFDLIICDEAHRTTGVTLSGDDESAFVKVHNNDFIRAKKRLYMTATPRLYNDDSKSRAAQADAILCSMDDENLYGKEMYRIGFGEAVDKKLLTDYKVLILTLSDSNVPPAVQNMIADERNEITSDDASKLIGCINALSKQVLGDEGSIKTTDPLPMRRAVAFCQNIAVSKKITSTFNGTANAYLGALPAEKRAEMVDIQSKHIDGTMSAPQRDELLSWLKADTVENECRVLTNVRCLSEGVDVPSLDAVMFLSARNSQVDVVQSVGRVMRLAEGKQYGYIIIPVIVPSDVEAEKALDDNERYKVVWTVLNALRAHDDRFNATVNKIELNKRRPAQILVGRPEVSFDEFGNPVSSHETDGTNTEINQQLALQFEQLQNVVFARMVQKVGDKRYWEQWAKSVAEIAERQIERIANLVKTGDDKQKFQEFLSGLQKNINPSITPQEAIEMLSQHIITKPVFEALFEGYSFVKNNAISVSMQGMLDLLEDNAFDKDAEILQKFYESVKMRASGIDNAEGKQRIIIELYDKFFKTAFPKMVERLGIVYTPVEVVDFIIHSVDDVLKKEFNRQVSDENVNILDPFTGTGTFITRLIQSGLIYKTDLERKYKHELYANEIILLAYYIAAVNIENAFHDAIATEYIPFDGICLTDTFQLGETDDHTKLFSEMFPQNSERVQRQKNTPITVIMGNPPYSVGQTSANDNAQNQTYPKLNTQIASTYVTKGTATNKNALYDSYIKAFRWSADRLGNNDGVIAFVSNGAWIDGNSTDGFRKCLEEEFSAIYVFNLRGNQRTSGELSRKEGGKIFGSGSRTPIAITLLIKKQNQTNKNAQIHYYDIGDYLSREQKLEIVRKYRSISNIEWQQLSPNEHGDWLSQRNDAFGEFIPIGDKDNKNNKNTFFSPNYSRGVATARDHFCWNFSNMNLVRNMNLIIDFYNEQCQSFKSEQKVNPKIEIDDFVTFDSTKITWNRGFKQDLERGTHFTFEANNIYVGLYRPFCKQYLYFSKELNDMIYQIPKLFPTPDIENLVICVSGLGGSKENTTLIINSIVDLNCLDSGTQCFPLYYYEENNTQQGNLFDNNENKYIRRDAVSDFILKRAKEQYGKNVSKEDIFYYVYGFLHSPKYRETFAADLKKMLPRLPLVEDVRDFWAFSKAGRKLAELHLNYESVVPYENVKVIDSKIVVNSEVSQKDEISSYSIAAEPEVLYITKPILEHYRVEQMRFPKGQKAKDKPDTILYNSKIRLENIPSEAYDYIVNGKSAIEWLMERYAITTHKESGIVNNPNDWAEEQHNPRYILDLLLSVINVSVQTVEIVRGLPEMEFDSFKKEGFQNERS